MGYRANERDKLSEDFVAAGDGLVAFGAAFILPVQTHYGIGKRAAEQWIYAKLEHAQAGLEADKQPQQIQPWRPNRPREGTWGITPAPSTRVRARPPQPREDRHACPPPHWPRSGGRRRLADAGHGAAVAR